jgi:signal peptidase I
MATTYNPLPTFSALARAASLLLLALCLLLLIHAFLLESYQISSGSMAPTLAGPHRETTCPRCGALIQVGPHPTAPTDHIFCPHCGRDIDLKAGTDKPGDRILVNKAAYWFAAPQRWDLAVFWYFGGRLIKRIIGLPGETVEIKGGDIFIDGELNRKSLAECEKLRILVFDSNHPPPGGWEARWQFSAAKTPANGLHGMDLFLHTEAGAKDYATATYGHFFLDEQKFAPIRNEYGYNSNQSLPRTFAHDFSIECTVEVKGEKGQFFVSLNDGADTVVAEIPIGQVDTPAMLGSGKLQTKNSAVKLPANGTCRVKMAFVDRRAIVRIQQQVLALDLPSTKNRQPVIRPVSLGVKGGQVVIKDFRLYRDVYYTQDGHNGIHGQPVRLGPDQYFVLGDNSPASEDSRFWPNQGAIEGTSLIGSPLRLP